MKKHSNLEYIKMIFLTDKKLFIVLVFSVLSAFIWDLLPIGVVAFILKIYQTDSSRHGFLLIILVCLAFTVIKLIYSGLSLYIYNDINLRITRRINYRLNKRLFEKISSIDYETYQSSSFLNNYQKVVDNGVYNMINTFWNFSDILERTLSIISLGTIFSLINPFIMLYGIGCGVIGFFVSTKSSKLYHKNSEKNKQHIRERGYVRRLFYLKDSAIDLRTTNINEFYLDMNDSIGYKIVHNIENYIGKASLLNAINDLLMQSIFGVSLGIIAYSVMQSHDIVILASLITAVSTFSEIIWSLSNTISNYKENIVYKTDYYRVMDTKSNVEEKYNKDITILEDFNSISFKSVDFLYGDKKVLDNINLEIRKHDKIAITGENGAGKTTFVKLLLRLYDVKNGCIYYNNIRYDEIKPELLRSSFVTVFQNYQIYAVSVCENILMRKCETKDDEDIVIEALKKVGLYDKVMASSKGIHSNCTKEFDKDGLEFSGGERQKLVIARVFAQNAPIILLDEPNSALDPLCEKKIFDELFKYSIDKTLIFISHRFSTTVNADKIYLFKDGKIHEEGSHEELMKLNNGEYKRMFNIQAEEYLKSGDNNENI